MYVRVCNFCDLCSREVQNLAVRLGEWDISSTSEAIPYQEIKVQEVKVHPQFNIKTLAYNVALLFLEREATLGPTVDTVCLPEHDQFFDGASCFSGGWGKDSFGRTGRYQKARTIMGFGASDRTLI